MLDNQPDDFLEAALMAAGDLAYAWNLANDNMIWRGHNQDIFAQNTAPANGDAFAQRIHPADMANRLKSLSSHINSRTPYEAEYRLYNAKGNLVWAHERGSISEHCDKKNPVLHGVIRVIENRKKRENRLEYLTNFDELTGHFNRSRLCENLGRTILMARRYETTGVYMTIAAIPSAGLDKEAQDTFLMAMGRQLDLSLRASDIVGRTGDNQFGIVLPRCQDSQAITIARKIIADMPRQSPVAIGLVSFPDLATTVSDALQKAEASLHQAMKTPDKPCKAYTLNARQKTERRNAMQLAEKTRHALSEGRMTLVFQPLFRREDGGVECYECLLRIRETDHRLTRASNFVPITETLGLARLIDRYVLEEVIKHLKHNPQLVLSMNISGMTVSDRAWLRAAITFLKEHPDIAGRMIIEITETSLIEDLEDCGRFVDMMQGLGCRIALDDFGAGHTSFRHLKSIPADMIKIAGIYIRGFSENAENQTFVKTMIDLAHGLGLQVVAEWVETQQDAELLMSMGADFLQGHYYGPERVEPTWPLKAPGTRR